MHGRLAPPDKGVCESRKGGDPHDLHNGGVVGQRNMNFNWFVEIAPNVLHVWHQVIQFLNLQQIVLINIINLEDWFLWNKEKIVDVAGVKNRLCGWV